MVKMFKRANGILYVEYKVEGRSIQKSTRLQDTKENRRLIKKEVIPALETESSIRDVPILDDLVPYLKFLPKSIWIFPTQEGKPYFAVSGQKKLAWSKLLEDCNIPYRKLYATRHTFIVSMLKNSNLSILEIAQMAGHNSTQMIIQNYGKFIKGEHLKIDREIKLFTDKSADSIA